MRFFEFCRLDERVAIPMLIPAVIYDGKVFPGRPGGDHFEILAKLPEEIKRRVGWNDDYRGFVNGRGTFMNRVKAQTYAVKHDLISDDAPSWARTQDHLVSEYLRGYKDNR